jgi:type II secretory pathway pseudopilin PulG
MAGRPHSHTHQKSRGFTLVEMLVVAPIVILFIGGMIYLLVNITGETLASRSEDALSFDLQQALNRVEDDVRRSDKFLAVNDIALTTTGQGYGDTTTTGSTTSFTNIAVGGGSPASLIIRTFAVNGNPTSSGTSLLYLANAPNDCSNPSTYVSNTPMTVDVVYFVDTGGTLWRRTIMPASYTSGTYYCGSAAPWQLPSCIVGYVAASRTFCKANDEKIADGATLTFAYYTNAAAGSPNATATDTGSSDTARNTALLTTKTVKVTITTSKTVAGRSISQSGSTYASRLTP